jgi:hypothetical protein
MLSDDDYQEAVRRYKNMRVNRHERQRYHALILVHQGYSYREVGWILLVDEETIRRWVEQALSTCRAPLLHGKVAAWTHCPPSSSIRITGSLSKSLVMRCGCTSGSV